MENIIQASLFDKIIFQIHLRLDEIVWGNLRANM
jgi:hypothetical protein